MSSENIDDLEILDPPEVDPYETLGLDKTATPDQVKSAYRKAALKHHPGTVSLVSLLSKNKRILLTYFAPPPDKAAPEDKAAAHTTFQAIALSYAVLSDPRRRSRYDITGRTDDSLDLDDDIFNWGDFYRAQFKDFVSSSSISQFTASYKGSDEERDALLKAYKKFKGDMNKVYNTVMVSNPADDDERFRDLINAAIEAGEVEPYDKFVGESEKSIQNRIATARAAGKEAEDYAKELGVHDKLFGGGDNDNAKGKGKKKAGKKGGAGDEDALAVLIQQRQGGRQENFLAQLEAKYGGGGKKSKKRGKREDLAEEEEPSEEAFAAMAKRAKKAKKNRDED